MDLKLLRIVLILALLPLVALLGMSIFVSTAFACDQNCRKGLVIGSQDDRLSIAEFSEEVQVSEGKIRDRYRASGQLICNGRRYSAQISIKSNIITTTAHSFYQSCENLVSVSDCKFRTSFDNSPREFKVKKLIEAGTSCPKVSRLGSDWAVAELEKSVEYVTPYKDPSEVLQSSSQVVGQEITHVAGSHWDLCDMGMCDSTISRCSIKNALKDSYGSSIFRMDCDAGISASGSAQILEVQDNLYMVSILASFADTNSGQPYDVDSVYSSSVPVQGRFLEVLRSLK